MTTLRRAFPVARRPHRCTSCNGPIRVGDRYHRWTGTGDCWEGIATAKDLFAYEREHLETPRVVIPDTPRPPRGT